ncbi:MAG TPA: hypothetical protein VLX92_27890 [Kofleriaceae bacterium]|nr:hypothetical protein [Kofleriaceae bacterium]
MRLAALAALAGCTAFDPARPIQLVTNGWSAHDQATLAAAAECWNLRFGTQLAVVPTPSADQVVAFDFDALACWSSWGRYLAGDPGHDSVCPVTDMIRSGLGDYWVGALLFTVVEHEIGHALNIPDVSSSDESVEMFSVMGENFQPSFAGGADAFSAFDAKVFGDANPDFTPAPACDHVRLVDDDDTEARCTCDQSSAFGRVAGIAITNVVPSGPDSQVTVPP